MSDSTVAQHESVPTERRCWVRYQCNQAAFCRSLSPQDFVFWTARARDICTAGISLDLSQRFEPGTILAVELLSTNQTFSHALRVRVIHITEQSGGGWRVGCEFVGKLSDAELRALL